MVTDGEGGRADGADEGSLAELVHPAPADITAQSTTAILRITHRSRTTTAAGCHATVGDASGDTIERHLRSGKRDAGAADTRHTRRVRAGLRIALIGTAVTLASTSSTTGAVASTGNSSPVGLGWCAAVRPSSGPVDTGHIVGSFIVGGRTSCNHAMTQAPPLRPGVYTVNLECMSCQVDTFTVTPTATSLPFTGAGSTWILVLAGVTSLTIGALIEASTRRRRAGI